MVIITIIARTTNRLMESLFISVYPMEFLAVFRKVIQTATGKYTALLFNNRISSLPRNILNRRDIMLSHLPPISRNIIRRCLLLLVHLQGPVQLFLKRCPSYNRSMTMLLRRLSNRIITPPVLPSPLRKLCLSTIRLTCIIREPHRFLEPMVRR